MSNKGNDNNKQNISNAVFTGLLKFAGVSFLLIVSLSIFNEIFATSSRSDELSQLVREGERLVEDSRRRQKEREVTQYIYPKLENEFSIGDAVAKRDDLSETGEITKKENKRIYVNWDRGNYDIELSENIQNLIIIDSTTKDIIHDPDVEELREEAVQKYEAERAREKQIEKGYELVTEEMLENFSYNDKIAMKDDLNKKGRVLEVIESGRRSRGYIKVEWEREELGDSNTIEVEKIVKLDSEDNIVWQPPSPSELPKNKFEKWIQDIF